jgi:hypothetical protein
MPKIIKVAWGEPARFMADKRTHQTAINPSQIEQYQTAQDEQGNEIAYALPQISLNAACRHCHVPDTALALDDETLIEAATGYHSPPAPTP